jgi:predicted phosphate transport protein (TIGR00153 family)
MRSLTRAFSGRDTGLFDLFDQAGTNIVRAAELLDDLLRVWPDHPELARDITICEQEGDRITHDVYHRLHSTFVTPLDREDIHALASSLDDIVDYIEEAADYLGLYRVEAPMHQAQQLADVIVRACRQISEALPELRRGGDMSRHTVEINRLENEGDRVTRSAIAALFDDGIDPMAVVRWKDIYERLEAAVDSTERVANVLEGIALKNS